MEPLLGAPSEIALEIVKLGAFSCPWGHQQGIYDRAPSRVGPRVGTQAVLLCSPWGQEGRDMAREAGVRHCHQSACNFLEEAERSCLLALQCAALCRERESF